MLAAAHHPTLRTEALIGRSSGTGLVPIPWDMRRPAWLLAVAVLGASLWVSVPAFASFGAVVDLGGTTFYSSFRGPATVTFTFGSSDPATIFRVRIREPGHAAIAKQDVLVDPSTQPSPHTVSFSWPKLSVSSPTDYVVDLRRQDDGSVITTAPFTLLPPLVTDLSARPSPFYPLVQDGYKDTTRIAFSLSADNAATVLHVYAGDTYGRCCGTEIRTATLGPLAAGAHRWTWDGRRDNATFPPKGTYFVRVTATDTNAVSATSKPLAVDLTSGLIRLSAKKRKAGSGYAGTADEQDLPGGNCYVTRNKTARSVEILCTNAAISVYWTWGLKPGERIESARFAIDAGYYGCHKEVSHTKRRSILRVSSPPTSSCTVTRATITYSYPYRA
jgi:hypothetical protein